MLSNYVVIAVMSSKKTNSLKYLAFSCNEFKFCASYLLDLLTIPYVQKFRNQRHPEFR
jgi:hypothetical protein